MSVDKFLTLFLFALYLTACQQDPRYIDTIKPSDLNTLKNEAVFDAYADSQMMLLDSLLVAAQAKAQESDFIAAIHERIYLLIDDKVAYSVEIDGKNISLEKGKNEGMEPTLLIPFNLQLAKNLDRALSDHQLSDAELFNFAYVLFVPCLKRMYSMPYLYGKDVSSVKLDNFIHIALRNDKGYTYHGQTVAVAATILNVDGMYMILKGLEGDPDIKVEFTISEALELYKLVCYDALKNSSVSEIKAGIDRYIELFEKGIVYERTWH